MSANPIITIGLTTYNRLDLLREAVQSILNQTYNDFVLLIGNDNPKILVTFELLQIPWDDRIKILNYSTNIGEIANMNNLLKLSNTEWFTWMADDDAFHSQFLEILVSTITNQTSSISAIYSSYLASEKLEVGFFNSVKPSKSILFPPSEFIPKYVSRKIHLIGSYGLMRTEILKKFGGMPKLGSSFSPYSDTLIPILLAEFGPINYINTPLVFLRTHSESLSVISSSFEAYSTAETGFLSRLENTCQKIPKVSVHDCTFEMVRWFRDNEFSVISRNQSISRIKVISSFISYQLNVNLSRIKIKFWIKFLLETLSLLFKVIKNSFLKKISKYTKVRHLY
jgi:glycosyltransferase involved in cell wall biosynthesis